MSAPIAFTADGPLWASLLGAVVIGLAFGAVLESAGLASARKLVGQFYLTDLTVLKTMFSAIVTALLGLFWLSRLGLLDLSRLAVPDTAIWPQAVGGCIFGLGFAVAGLCPGTSCVAAASGRVDGLLVVAGVFAGVLGTGLADAESRWFQWFYALGDRGALTLPALLHLPSGVVVFGVVAMALAAFQVAERVERRSR
jgi:uncharacterized membrane protein YedE/YeeE